MVKNKTQVAQLKIELFESVNKKNYTNLKSCIQQAHDIGVSLDVKNSKGSTALHIAAGSGNFEMVQLLIGCGASIDIKNLKGFTALHIATRSGSFEMLQFLLDHGANVNNRARDNSTPLHAIAQHQRYKLNAVQLLLDRGADLTAKDLKGRTASQIATQYRNLELAKFLDNYTSTVTEVPFINNTIMSSLPNHLCPVKSVTEASFVDNTITSSLPLPSAPRGTISGNSGGFSDTIVPWLLIGFLAMLAPLFVFAVVFRKSKMRVPQESQDVQPNVEVVEGLLDERINFAAANLHEGIKKFGARYDELPVGSLNNINTSKGVGFTLNL